MKAVNFWGGFFYFLFLGKLLPVVKMWETTPLFFENFFVQGEGHVFKCQCAEYLPENAKRLIGVPKAAVHPLTFHC